MISKIWNIFIIYDILSMIYYHECIVISQYLFVRRIEHPTSPQSSHVWCLSPHSYRFPRCSMGVFPTGDVDFHFDTINRHQISLKPVFLLLNIPMSFSTITMSFSRWTAGLLVLIMPWQVSQDILLQQHQWCGARQSRRRLDVVDTALTEEGSWGATVLNMHLWVLWLLYAVR